MTGTATRISGVTACQHGAVSYTYNGGSDVCGVVNLVDSTDKLCDTSGSNNYCYTLTSSNHENGSNMQGDSGAPVTTGSSLIGVLAGSYSGGGTIFSEISHIGTVNLRVGF